MSIGIGVGVIRDSGPSVGCGEGYYNAVKAAETLYGAEFYYRFENPTANVDSSESHLMLVGDGYGSAGSTSVTGLYPSPCPGLARSMPGSGYWDVLTSTSSTISATFVAGVSLVDSTGDRNIVASIVGAISAAHTIMFGYESDGRPLVQCYGSAGATVLGPTSLTGAGTRHLAWRWNQTTFAVDIFINGVKVATGNNSGGLNPGSGLNQFGAANGRNFKGTVDEAVWFRAALPDAAITTLYNAWLAGV
jgi:hypothetical protein